MPSKVWTVDADFDEGTHVGTEADGDVLKLADGYADGYWESQVYEAANWEHWTQWNIAAVRPTGCAIVYRFRSGATSGECSSADWTPWMDGFDTDGNLSESLFAYYLNNPGATVGAFFQVQIRLVKE